MHAPTAGAGGPCQRRWSAATRGVQSENRRPLAATQYRAVRQSCTQADSLAPRASHGIGRGATAIVARRKLGFCGPSCRAFRCRGHAEEGEDEPVHCAEPPLKPLEVAAGNGCSLEDASPEIRADRIE